MTTRPSALSPEDVDRLVKVLEQRGGSVTIQDPRVSQVQTWMWGVIGICVIGLGGWLINSVNALNQTMQRVVVTNEYVVKIVDAHDRRIADLERRRDRDDAR